MLTINWFLQLVSGSRVIPESWTVLREWWKVSYLGETGLLFGATIWTEEHWRGCPSSRQFPISRSLFASNDWKTENAETNWGEIPQGERFTVFVFIGTFSIKNSNVRKICNSRAWWISTLINIWGWDRLRNIHKCLPFNLYKSQIVYLLIVKVKLDNYGYNVNKSWKHNYL